MHIVTGMLIAGLLGNRKRPRLLPMLRTGPVRTAHWIPGRVRFQVPSLRGNAEGARLLAEKLPTLQGVHSVELNRTTGSVLIRYRPDDVAPELIFAAIVRLLDLESELAHTPQPALVRELREFVGSLNRTVYDRTSGLLDFSSAALILLAAAGVKACLTEGARAFPAGFTLVWWGLSQLLGHRGE
jgi:hypothetical protein